MIPRDSIVWRTDLSDLLPTSALYGRMNGDTDVVGKIVSIENPSTITRNFAGMVSNERLAVAVTRMADATASGTTLAPFLGITTTTPHDNCMIAVYEAKGCSLSDLIAAKTPTTVGHVKQLMVDVIHAVLHAQREGFLITAEDIDPSFIFWHLDVSKVVRFHVAGFGCLNLGAAFEDTLGDRRSDPREISSKLAEVVSDFVVASLGRGVIPDCQRNCVSPIHPADPRPTAAHSEGFTSVSMSFSPLSSVVRHAATILRQLRAHSLADVLVNCATCHSLKTWSLASLMFQLRSMSLNSSNSSAPVTFVYQAKPPQPHVSRLPAATSTPPNSTLPKRRNSSQRSLAEEMLESPPESCNRLPLVRDERVLGERERLPTSAASTPQVSSHSMGKIERITLMPARRASIGDAPPRHPLTSRYPSPASVKVHNELPPSSKSNVVRINSLAKLAATKCTQDLDAEDVVPTAPPASALEVHPSSILDTQVQEANRRSSLSLLKSTLLDSKTDGLETSFHEELQAESRFPSPDVLESYGVVTSRKPADLLLSTLAALDDHAPDLAATLVLVKVLHSLSMSKKRVSLLASVTCVRRIVRAVSIHITSINVHLQCCEILHAVCGVKGGTVIVLDSGGVAAISDMLRLSISCENTRLCESTLNLVQKLSIKHTVDRHLWTSLQCSQWFAELEEMMSSEPVVRALLRVVVTMTRNGTVAEAFTSAYCWQPVLEMLQTRIAVADIVELCLYVACNLSNCKCNVPAICTQAAAFAVIGAMETHINNGNIQQLGCAALCLFATTKATARILSHACAVSSILAAMRLCPNNVGLQANACQALCYLISYVPETLTEAVYKAVRLADVLFPSEPDIAVQARAIRRAYERLLAATPAQSPPKLTKAPDSRGGLMSRLGKRLSL